MDTITETIRAVNEALAESREPDIDFLRHCVEHLARSEDQRAGDCIDDIVSILEERGRADDADALAGIRRLAGDAGCDLKAIENTLQAPSALDSASTSCSRPASKQSARRAAERR